MLIQEFGLQFLRETKNCTSGEFTFLIHVFLREQSVPLIVIRSESNFHRKLLSTIMIERFRKEMDQILYMYFAYYGG